MTFSPSAPPTTSPQNTPERVKASGPYTQSCGSKPMCTLEQEFSTELLPSGLALSESQLF